MSSPYEADSEESCGSESPTPSLSHGQENAHMSTTETSPLLAIAADVPPRPVALHMSLARKAQLIGTIAASGLLSVRAYPLLRAVWARSYDPKVLKIDTIKRLVIQATVIMIPSIGRAFSVPPSRQQMLFSTYSIAAGSSMLLWGRMADVRGRWGVYLAGTAAVPLITFLLPFSPSETWLYVFQVFQGFGTAATVPSGVGIIAATFPPGRERNVAFVALSTSSGLGAVLGNITGGAIGGLLSWRWCFWIPAAMATAVALSAYTLYSSRPSSRPSSQDRLIDDSDLNKNLESVDYTGGFLIFSSLTLLQVGVSQGTVDGWANLHVISLVCASVVIGYIFVMLQLRMENAAQHPLVRPSMFRSTCFSAIFGVTICFFGSYNPFLVFASAFFQDVQKLSMLETTYRFLPGGIIGSLACFLVAPALSDIPGFYILIFGITCSIVAPLLFALPMSPDGASFSYWARGFPAMCLCISPELVWPVIALHVARSVPESDQSLASSLMQAAIPVGRGLGLGLATAAQDIAASAGPQEPDGAPLVRGLQAAQWANVGMSCVSLAIAFVFFRGLGRA